MSESPKAVFLSYAREDAEAARRIADALRAFGVEAWFDQAELRGGEAWDAKIKKQIRECALFLPVVSARTQARTEGYFRREWKLAVERTHDMAAGVAFIVPVVIDETRESEAAVPEEFMRVQWTRLVHGVPTPQFVEQVRRLLAAGSAAGSDRSSPRSAARAAPVPRARVPVWTWVALAGAVGVGAFFATKKSGSPAPDATVASMPAAARPVVNPKSVAVLPFENLSPAKDDEFFASGIREEILTNLQTVRDLRVIQYRGASRSARQIGDELGVAYALECSVRRVGTKVRVMAKLTNARTEEQVWVKPFERDLSDLFLIQSELAQAIAGELSVVITPVEKDALERRPTTSVAAYDLYLKARDIRVRAVNTESATDRTESLLRSAVELDPEFALAWGELAFTHGYKYSDNQDRSEARASQARAALAMMEKLAPNDPETIRQQGDYYYFVPRDYPRATDLFLRLVVLRPNDPESYFSLFQVQRRQGRWADALESGRKAIALDPQNDRLLRNAARVLTVVRHYNEAIVLQQRRIGLGSGNDDPDFVIASMHFFARGSTAEGDAALKNRSANGRMFWALLKGDAVEIARIDPELSNGRREYFGTEVAFNLLAQGNPTAARARVSLYEEPWKAALVTQPTNSFIWMDLAELQLVTGRPEEALASSRKAVELRPEATEALDGPALAVRRARIDAWAGQTERALAEFARLLGTGAANVHRLRTMPLPAAVRSDPRFETLLNDPKNNAPLF